MTFDKIKDTFREIMAIPSVEERRKRADKFYANIEHVYVNRELWKIARDPYYASMYLMSPSLLEDAGFFKDNIETYPTIDTLKGSPLVVIPTNKIVSSRIGKKIILVSTGAYSPIHEGHVEMMEIAKKELKSRGYDVIGGYIAPDNQSYVKSKYGVSIMPAVERLERCEEMLRESPWLMVDRFGLYHTTKDVNFTEIIYHLEKFFPDVTIGYVYGSDNAGFGRVFHVKNVGICVNRSNGRKKFDSFKVELANEKMSFLLMNLTDRFSV